MSVVDVNKFIGDFDFVVYFDVLGIKIEEVIIC